MNNQTIRFITASKYAFFVNFINEMIIIIYKVKCLYIYILRINYIYFIL